MPLLKSAWTKVKGCLGINAITSTGIRYINQIGSEYSLSTGEVFNKGSEYVPAAIVENILGFYNRSEIALDVHNRFVIQAATAHHPEKSGEKVVILDIDRIYENRVVLNGVEMPSNLGELQAEIESVFFSSVSDKLKEKMK